MIESYRKKPIVIKVLLWNGKNIDECEDFCGKDGFLGRKDGEFIIRTIGGNVIAEVGDYIVKGVAGEFYPCKPDIFHTTYNEVAELTIPV